MKKFNKFLFIIILLVSSCVNTKNSQLQQNNSSFVSSISSSSVDSEQQEKLLKIEIDKLFIETLSKQREINGNLLMYDQLENLYGRANHNRRRKAIYHMSLNPKLDEYLNNTLIYIRMGLILNDETKVFIPEDEKSGFLIPYVITLPDEKYKKENEGYKNYAFFQMGGSPVNNQPYFSLLNAFQIYKIFRSNRLFLSL